LRDTHLLSASATIAQFDRIYNNGSKNHFVMLGSSDKEKFDSMYLKDDKLKTPVKETEKAVSDDEDESQAGGDQ
jgi:hypothetical protein